VPVPLNYASRSVFARRATTAATGLGIALVVFVLAASQMLSAGMRSTLLRAGSTRKALVMSTGAYSEDGSRIQQLVLTAAGGAPGVKRASAGEPLVTGEAVVQIFLPRLDDETRINAVQVRGVSENVVALRPEVRIVSGRAAQPGTDEAIIGKGIAGEYLGLQLGGRVMLKKGRDISIVGVFSADRASYESEIWTGLDVVRTSLGWEGYLSSVTAVLESPAAFDGFAAAIESDRSKGLEVVVERSYYEKVSEGLSHGIQVLGDLVTVIFACSAMLGALITMNAAISQRRREIGVLRALGFSAPEVMVAFLVESGTLAVGGALLGICLALPLSLVRLSVFNYGTGNQITFPFEVDGAIVLRAAALGVLVGVLGGFFPALKAARTDPVFAMRP
jgi:putative ABC transport system permease protein